MSNTKTLGLSWPPILSGIATSLWSFSSKAYKKLGLLCCTFSSAVHINAKRSLYLSLIRSELVYCSQIWRPYLLKDITLLERVQRWATKFILNDYSSNYKSRLITLRLLPLMMVYELYDISFFIKCLKCPMASFNIIKLQLYQILRWQHRIKFIWTSILTPIKVCCYVPNYKYICCLSFSLFLSVKLETYYPGCYFCIYIADLRLLCCKAILIIIIIIIIITITYT